ncbi:Protein translocase subunit SecA [Orchesella cincta]|uniref:Protein translocase subunit SecA n=1 Tax=Orchesella cincta TaxID=48709 RepID=A0A1D2MZP3_ORCCI|nr:Protein translocase subunit SecA [Orchesella cincta]
MYFKTITFVFLFFISAVSARKKHDSSSSSSSEEDDSGSREMLFPRARTLMCGGEPFNFQRMEMEKEVEIEECLETKLDETMDVLKNSRRKSTRRLGNDERKLKRLLKSECSMECKWEAFGLISDDEAETGAEEFSKLFPEGAQDSVKAEIETCIKGSGRPKRKSSRGRMSGFCQAKKRMGDCLEKAVTQNSTRGGIAYKAFDPLEPNSRCVWTIRGGNSVGFTASVLKIRSDSSDQDVQVIVTCLRHQDTPSRHIHLNQSGPVNGLEMCNMLVITLYSGLNVGNSTGFILEYEALGEGTLSSKSKDYIFGAEGLGFIRYPESVTDQYDNFELSTFVFVPENNIHVEGSNADILYHRNSLESYFCHDNVNVYRFISNLTVPTWQYEGRICGDTESDVIKHYDMIMLTFDSDYSNTGSGFQLAYTPSNACECGL